VKYEIVSIRAEVHPQDSSKVWLVQIAVNGKLAPAFYDHEINRRKFRTDEEWFAHLAQCAESLMRESLAA